MAILSFEFQGSGDICSIRLVFETFSVAGPVTSSVSETSGVSRTQCQGAQFSVNTDGDILSSMSRLIVIYDPRSTTSGNLWREWRPAHDH